MFALRPRNLKVLAAFLFVISVTSFMLNYIEHLGSINWYPEKYLSSFPEQIKRLIQPTWRPCSCARCISEPSLSVWFHERFNQSVPPLLTKHSTIPDDVYHWWLKLQVEEKPKNLSKALVDVFELIPGHSDFPAPDAFRCRRCAVVGNSGNLLKSNYGSIIDSHDIIMRMNRAETVHFENDVGSRTTHHFLYPESYIKLAENVTLVFLPFKTLDLQWLVSALTTGVIRFTYMNVPRWIDTKKDKIIIFNPTFMKYVSDIWMQGHGKYPSTGILVTIFALHMCDEVNLFGFGADSKGNWHHYWEDIISLDFQKSVIHDSIFQTNVTKMLSSINKIQFFSGR
ncbi:CMP-N-acetylneuraminate-beta-galactosamide-alpha-2,3-sialyltransferase 1-like isoform X1 [Rhinatrema bivittatum]|uniref:CMP-N-acetylneuraminate-beta-galactosamide- alpha-2,3-sialyltransferase 1-like isoform X1 n=1 Tax=Rhinatrema bivittatum TaxID=194408 RepID=UPI0011271753|nr:CMP-N-acetylneuraminate-beta-galactosamide-alpha-2,3-sialyltransferase 1-like isoform X1 [Rhinatrema bivittatum]XP_029447923.1 CMP-N-acetylneuraminate-beta-galactosamide-alpha-2,3-sialyltransferase 1-like isoform X1 [Rhinatrema bivittatum]